MQQPLLRQKRADLANLVRAESFVGTNRQLKRRALQMAQQNLEVVRVHISMLRRPVEQILRMLDHILIDWRARRHHNRERSRMTPPRAAGPLPGGGDRTWIPRHHNGIERADIDAQFQRVRRHHRPDLARAQPLLDLATLPRQIAAPIAPYGLGRQPLLIECVFQIRDQNLGRQPVVRKHQRLLIAVEQFHARCAAFR